ncbi:MAG TPA: glycerophosphodiester phosphodiesterase family protein [Stackebrandtia sp.]|uniref:glycerophosphodiester phosphodiesterase n=1 Tax=Stackebrandtia sp. TaxID=2023065 RepID=UPI002D266BDB|nr:glycerophosphodiester phosphodiesterase family protein [Stackebrandtia sp.]HZE37796.1 glycerophosphodiester phosphodiesterase family protein [Stackebrandtia sp.]
MPHPMVVAHRGANVDLPEQSLAAYTRAVEVGADAIECDVRLTKDGHLVCHHDRTIGRTSDGKGAISELTLDELLKFNFSGHHPREGEHHQILPFDTLLRLVSEAPRQVTMLIEAKHPSRFGAQVEHALHKALSEYPTVDVVVMSFARAAVTRYRELDADVPLVWLFEYPVAGPPRGAGILGPRIDVLRARPRLIERAHAAGQRVFVWTCNTPGDVRYVAEAGADAIITDDPAMALETLGR